jgi:4-amino-4-deoxy-L-arabinose transferase-like glycosyltransferase
MQPRQDSGSGGVLRLLLYAVILVGAALNIIATMRDNRLLTGDEGWYATVALNVTRSPDYLAMPTAKPLLDVAHIPPEKFPSGDLQVNTSSLVPAILAAPLGLSTEVWPMRLVSLAAFALAILGFYLLIREMAGSLSALAAAAFMAISPSLGEYFREIACEPYLVMFGVWALYMAITAEKRESRGRLILAGLLFGLGFLAKLWLIGLCILPLIFYVLFRGERRWLLRNCLFVVLPFLAVSSIHLVAAFLYRTEYGSLLLNYGYAFFSSVGKVQGINAAEFWLQPAYYYFAVTYRTSWFIAPWAVIGAIRLVRVVFHRSEEPKSRAAALFWLVWMLQIIPMSIMRVKAALYFLPVAISFYAVAAIGLSVAISALTNRSREERPKAALALSILVLGLAGAMLGLHLRGFRHRDFATSLLVFHTAIFLIYAAAFARIYFTRAAITARQLAVMGAILLLPVAVFSASAAFVQQPKNHYKEISAYMLPVEEDADPAQETFIAPAFRMFGYYLFRDGRYWETYYRSDTDKSALKRDIASGKYRFFVINRTTKDDTGDGYGGNARPETLEWVRENCVDVTADVEKKYGIELDVFVFVHKKYADRVAADHSTIALHATRPSRTAMLTP